MNDRCSQEIVHMDIISHFSSSSLVLGGHIHLVLMFYTCACAFVFVCVCVPVLLQSVIAWLGNPWLSDICAHKHLPVVHETEDKDSSKQGKKLGNMKMKEWKTGKESGTKCSLCFLLWILKMVVILPVARVDKSRFQLREKQSRPKSEWGFTSGSQTIPITARHVG